MIFINFSWAVGLEEERARMRGILNLILINKPKQEETEAISIWKKTWIKIR